MTKLFVGSLPFETTEDQLHQMFTPHGTVESAKLSNDCESGRSRGFGFVEMPDTAAAQKAIAELDNGTVDGRTIKVMEARPREDRPARKDRW